MASKPDNKVIHPLAASYHKQEKRISDVRLEVSFNILLCLFKYFIC
jgi:hypothetical protein